jgi:hypothetical protein
MAQRAWTPCARAPAAPRRARTPPPRAALPEPSAAAPPPPSAAARERRAAAATAADAVLTGVGLSPEAARATLGLAAAARARGGVRDGEPSAASVAATCDVLARAGVPVRELGAAFARAPRLLAAGPAALEAQYAALLAAWSDAAALRRAVRKAPAMLDQSFAAALPRGLALLDELGFSPAQSARCLVGEPALVNLRRFELLNHLREVGLELNGAPPTVFAFLAARPALLTAAGGAPLGALMRRLRALGLGPAAAAAAAARCPPLLSAPPDASAAAVAALRAHGLDAAQIARVVRGWPAVLRAPERVRETLSLLRAAGLSDPALVAAYPRAFAHSTLRVVGPRLALLRAEAPEALARCGLATLFTRGDEAFLAERVEDYSLEAYEGFIIAWQERWARERTARTAVAQERAAAATKKE